MAGPSSSWLLSFGSDLQHRTMRGHTLTQLIKTRVSGSLELFHLFSSSVAVGCRGSRLLEYGDKIKTRAPGYLELFNLFSSSVAVRCRGYSLFKYGDKITTKAAGSLEMLIIIDRIPWRHVLEDSYLHTHRGENLKPHILQRFMPMIRRSVLVSWTLYSVWHPEHNASEGKSAPNLMWRCQLSSAPQKLVI